MADSNQILPLRRTPDDKQKRLKGTADKRSRPKIETHIQVDRLGGLMSRTFTDILDRDDIDVARDPGAMAPERALVLEIIGRPASFVKAAEKAGLEWLAEEVALLHGVTEYFDIGGDEYDDEEAAPEAEEFNNLLGVNLVANEPLEAFEDVTEGRLYLGMPTVASFERLRRLWDAYAANEKAPEGDGVWWDLFSHLHRIRPWNADDRVSDATRRRLRVERTRSPEEEVRIEVDLWYRFDPRHRDDAYDAFRTTIEAIGGEILDVIRIEEIRYHSALIRLPSSAVDAIVTGSGPLAFSDQVMSIRPQSSFRFAIDEHNPESVEASSEVLQPADGKSIGAMIDGWPVENHALLRDRIDVIPLDVADSMAPVNTRFHGTAMASLILRGDGHFGAEPLSRVLKIVPVLESDDNDERPPIDKLPLGLIHRAVRELKEGTDGQPPSGPDVVIINHSICDEAFGFSGSVSPWARLLDHLSWKYKVLFVVSAGNIREPFDVLDYPDAVQMRAATPDHRRAAILRAIDAAKSQRTIFAPAESVNALTVAAAHSDGSTDILPASLSDPYVSFSAPNINSGLGLGFGRSVKPDVMLPGGRQVAHPTMSGVLRVRGHEAAAYFGQKVASPDPATGDVTMVRRSSGTSNAAALATRAGLLIGDVLDASPDPTGDGVPWHARPTAAPVLKALIAHGASWGDVGIGMTDVHRSSMSLPRAKETVSRAIGYGHVDPSRIVSGDRKRVTLLGQDLIRKEQRHTWRIPLPFDLSSSAEFRRIVLTLAWLTPVKANSSTYRMIGLEMVGGDGRSSIWEGAARASHQPSVASSKNGTLIHAVYEGKKAVPFDENGVFEINVQAVSRLTYVSDIQIPYALAVTIEVADTISADIRDTIRRRMGLQVRSGA